MIKYSYVYGVVTWLEKCLYFDRGVCKEFGSNIALVMLGVMVFAAGMFTASTAFLPSSFAM